MVDFALVLALHALDVDLEVELAHAADDRLVGLGIDVDAEGRVLLGEAVEGLAHLVRGLLVLRLDGEGDDGLGHVHRGHRVVEVGVAEGVARGALDAEEGHDVAVVALGDVLHGVGVHAHEAADLEALARARVVELGALLDVALVDADVGELAVLAVLELEAEGHGLLGRVGLEDDLLLARCPGRGLCW